MITETKEPFLLPTLDKTPAQARREHFAKYPPKTNGDLPNWRPSVTVAEASDIQADRVKSTRRKERGRLFRELAPYLGALVAAGTLTGYIANNKLSQPKSKTIMASVMPGEGIDHLVQRVEHKYGQDTYGFDYQSEEYRLSLNHPAPLQSGERIAVHVK